MGPISVAFIYMNVEFISLAHRQPNSGCTPPIPPKMMFSLPTAMKVCKFLTSPIHAGIFTVLLFYMSFECSYNYDFTGVVAMS